MHSEYASLSGQVGEKLRRDAYCSVDFSRASRVRLDHIVRLMWLARAEVRTSTDFDLSVQQLNH